MPLPTWVSKGDKNWRYGPYCQACPRETLSTICSLLPTFGPFYALCFIHPFIQQKSAGSFSMPCTVLASARDIELGPCQPTHLQAGTFINMLAVRRVVWIEVCVGLGDGWCVCMWPVRGMWVCVGADRFSMEGLLCTSMCICIG